MSDAGSDASSDDSRAEPDGGQVSVHRPVLLQESLEAMALRPGMVVVDGTIGAGGHGSAFAEAISPGGVLIGCDRDRDVLAHAEQALARARAAGREFRSALRHASYAEIEGILADDGVEVCDRVFLDLGVSSLQLDSPERGFSLMHDGPLDMRMDRAETAAPTAATFLRTVSERELERVLRDFGEERYSRRIAAAIVEARRRHPIDRTTQLVDVVCRAVPGLRASGGGDRRRRRHRIHPATRTFQAIRIAVNDELSTLQRGLAAGLRAVRPGGRIVAIAFHSLEDRIVKRFLREHCDLPFKKPVRPGAAECDANPRARSARLRCGIRRAA